MIKRPGRLPDRLITWEMMPVLDGTPHRPARVRPSTYLDVIRHWDAVLPGRVLRVWLEDLVEDLERQVRRILEFCGLEFESACVEYYQTARSVRTASSEQVRQPIFRDGLFEWRNYEPWLGRLKDDLDDALIRYRD